MRLPVAVAATILACASASAADMPVAVKAPAYAPPPASWTGFYIGAQGGYQWGVFRTREFVGAIQTSLNERPSADGWIGGVHAGFNYQSGGTVWGIEADVEATDTTAGFRFVNSGDGIDFRSRWHGSLRGRVGVTWNPVLFYVTGGLAFADLQHTYVGNWTNFEHIGTTRLGWTVGAGAEWLFAPAWSARLEYRFADYGEVTNFSQMFNATYKHDPEFHMVRAGVSYRFGAVR